MLLLLVSQITIHQELMLSDENYKSLKNTWSANISLETFKMKYSYQYQANRNNWYSSSSNNCMPKNDRSLYLQDVLMGTIPYNYRGN